MLTKNLPLMKALADITRITVVDMLFKQRSRQGILVAEMLEKIQIDSTLLSHHLKILREANVVECEREGKKIRYFLNKKVFNKAIKICTSVSLVAK